MIIYLLRSALMSELEELDDNRTLDELCEPAFDSLHDSDTISNAVDRAKEDLEAGYRDEFDRPFDSPIKLTWETEPGIPGLSNGELTYHSLYDDGDLVGRIAVVEARLSD